MQDEPIYSKKIIEIADYIFANPEKNMTEVLSYFVKKCHKTERTVNRYIKQAKKYNKTRLENQENEKNILLTQQAKEAFKKGIGTREELLKFYWDEINLYRDMKEGKRRTSLAEIISAGREIAKIEGWNAPIKNEITGSEGEPLLPQNITLRIVEAKEQIKKHPDDELK